MWNVIDSCYGGNMGCEESTTILDKVTRIFQMEKHLVEWTRSLPGYLGLRSSQDIPFEDETAFLEKARVVITLRYQNLRVLLHRSVLVEYLDMVGKQDCDGQELVLLQQIGSNSLNICVNSAMEIILIISTIVSSDGPRRQFLGAWWFSLYYSRLFVSSLKHPCR